MKAMEIINIGPSVLVLVLLSSVTSTMLHGHTNHIMASSKQAVAVLASMFNVKVYDPKRWIMVFVINGIYQDTKYCP